MVVFISWSGEKSKIIAEFLQTWLRQVIQALDPWISIDIDKGSRWNHEMSSKLEESKIGIICLTPENINSKWILFEAGALSKFKNDHVCTLLIGMNSTDVEQPLAQFQDTKISKDDFKKLIININELVRNNGEKNVPEKILDTVFEMNWPSLESKLSEVLNLTVGENVDKRNEKDLLMEILEIVRNQERTMNSLERQIELNRVRDAVSKMFSKPRKNDSIMSTILEGQSNYWTNKLKTEHEDESNQE